MGLFDEQYLVLDYGTSTLKGVLYHSQGRESRVVRSARLELQEPPEGYFAPGPEEFRTYEYNLNHFLSTHFPEEQHYLLNLPLDQLYIRDLQMEGIRRDKINDVLPAEVESLLPVPFEEHEVVGSIRPGGEDSHSIISFSVERKELQGRALPILRNKGTIQLFTPESCGLASIVNLLEKGDVEGHILGQLDVGGDYTLFNILQEGVLIFSRMIPLGGAEVTRRIAKFLSVDQEEAERIKRELPIHLGDESGNPTSGDLPSPVTITRFKELHRVLTEFYGELAMEISRTLVSQPNISLDRIYLSGGAAQMTGVNSLLERELETSVIEYPFVIQEGESFAPWAVAVGLSEHYRQARKERVDFLQTPTGLRLRRGEFHFRDVSPPSLTLLAGILLLLISFILGMVRDRSEIRLYKNRISEIARQIPGLKPGQNPYQEARKLCLERSRSAGFGGGGRSVLELLQEVSDYAPDPSTMEFRLIKFEYSEEEVELEAEVDRLTDATDVEKSFQKSKRFKSVNVKSDLKADRKVRLRIKLELNKTGAGRGVDCQ